MDVSTSIDYGRKYVIYINFRQLQQEITTPVINDVVIKRYDVNLSIPKHPIQILEKLSYILKKKVTSSHTLFFHGPSKSDFLKYHMLKVTLLSNIYHHFGKDFLFEKDKNKRVHKY